MLAGRQAIDGNEQKGGRRPKSASRQPPSGGGGVLPTGHGHLLPCPFGRARPKAVPIPGPTIPTDRALSSARPFFGSGFPRCDSNRKEPHASTQTATAGDVLHGHRQFDQPWNYHA